MAPSERDLSILLLFSNPQTKQRGAHPYRPHLPPTPRPNPTYRRRWELPTTQAPPPANLPARRSPSSHLAHRPSPPLKLGRRQIPSPAAFEPPILSPTARTKSPPAPPLRLYRRRPTPQLQPAPSRQRMPWPIRVLALNSTAAGVPNPRHGSRSGPC
jgi:hypothetical protein